MTPICLECNISKTAGDAIEQQSLITAVCCDAVWSAIIATAGLLVETEKSIHHTVDVSAFVVVMVK